MFVAEQQIATSLTKRPTNYFKLKSPVDSTGSAKMAVCSQHCVCHTIDKINRICLLF